MADKNVTVIYWGWAVMVDGERIMPMNADPMTKNEAVVKAREFCKGNRPCDLKIHGQGPNQEIKHSVFTGQSEQMALPAPDPEVEEEATKTPNFFGRGGK